MHPPMICVLCGSAGTFSSEEHIVPHSLGNDLVVLAPGWICDSCNNVCSAFESRALSGSILGLERCRLGVITKKRKPARASLYGVTWFAEPTANANIVSAEADWGQIPVLLRRDGTSVMAVLLHDETNADLARLLLKMGVELLAVHDRGQGTERARRAAKDVILGMDASPWPYFVLRDGKSLSYLSSVFETDPEAREYIRSLGFDLYLHEIEDREILFFQFGQFLAATSITSRSVGWTAVFEQWHTAYVGCPIEFAHLHG